MLGPETLYPTDAHTPQPEWAAPKIVSVGVSGYAVALSPPGHLLPSLGSLPAAICRALGMPFVAVSWPLLMQSRRRSPRASSLRMRVASVQSVPVAGLRLDGAFSTRFPSPSPPLRPTCSARIAPSLIARTCLAARGVHLVRKTDMLLASLM